MRFCLEWQRRGVAPLGLRDLVAPDVDYEPNGVTPVQYVFAVHVAVDDAGGAGGEDSATVFDELCFEIVSWLRGRHRLSIENVHSGAADSNGASAQWSTASGEAGRLRTFQVEHPDSEKKPWVWQVTVWVGQERDVAWVRARVGIRPTRENQVVDPGVAVGTPRFIQSVVQKYGSTADGLAVGTTSRVSVAGAQGYVAFLRDPDRGLPVVAITRQANGQFAIDPDVVATRLRAVAHVVCIDPNATYLVSDQVTPQLSCFGGAVRIYWPGFTNEAVPLSHPLWVPRGLMTADAIVTEVVARVGRAAALTYGAPRLEVRLRREASARQMAAARAEREALAAEREALLQAEGGLSAEEFEAFSAEFSDLETRAAGYEQRIDDLELELELARTEREREKEAERQAWALVAESQQQQETATPEVIEDAAPASVLEAVEIAAERCSNLRILQSAFESAAASQYTDPELVLADLVLLDEVAAMWVADELNADFRTEFKNRHGGFRADVSDTAGTRYSEDYTISYDGKTALMGPHLRRGKGPPAKILGIYWFKDDALKKLVVGHVGRKLRDESNKN